MCGYIIGFTKNVNFLDYENLLEPRGPDGRSYIRYDEFNFQCLFRRLKLVGETPQSNQPVLLGKFVLVFNGEIFNYRELVLEYSLASSLDIGYGDTDVLAELLKIHNFDLKKIVPLLRGMFSISLFNLYSKDIQIARDYFGKKPLFFTFDSDSFIAGSNSTIISKLSGNIKISKLNLLYSICWGYILPGNSIWNDVYEVLPGEILEVKGSIIYREKYNIIPKKKENFESDLKNSILSRIDQIHDNSIFLSSGRDSILLNSILDKYTHSKKFTINFDNITTNSLSNNIFYNRETHLKMIEELMKVSDEPILDSASFPLYYVMKYFSDENQKVFFTGDGADELDYGYLWYKRIHLLSKFNFFDIDISNSKYLNALFKKDFSLKVNLIRSFVPFDILNKYDIYLPNTFTTCSDVSNYDVNYFLPQTILKKLDRASMFASKEIRNPFLDEDLFLNYKQSSQFNKPNITKLFKSLVGTIPKKKKGFDLPLVKWLSLDMKPEIDLSLKFLRQNLDIKLLDIDFNFEHMKRYPYFYWNLYQFGIWSKYHL